MTKQELFNLILTHTSHAFDVEIDDIMGGKRTRDVVDARSIIVHCCLICGLTYADMLKFTGRKHLNSISSIASAHSSKCKICQSFRTMSDDIYRKVLAEIK